MMGLSGRIPLRIRVGVTGHRALSDEISISAKVDDALSRLQRRLPPTAATPVLYEVVSPLGEGADRIVAERVLRFASSTLEVPLPLPREEYEQDFASTASRRRFGNLLDRAEGVWVVGGSDRLDAYRRAGEYVVDSCDVLIAIWDGKPSRGTGGTRDILETARRRGMPVFVVDAQPPFGVHEERMPSSFRLFREVDRYNSLDLSVPSDETTRLVPTSDAPSGEEEEIFVRCLSWIEMPFRRADAVAKRYRRRFLVASRLLFLMSAMATLSVAVSVESTDGRRQTFAYLEVALMLAALALWLLVRHRLHGRWITARFLAERFRSAMFLAFLGSQNVVEPEGEHRGNAQEWLTRVFREIWRSRPRLDDSQRDVERVQDFLCRAWVDPQIAYYRRRSRSHATALRVLTAASLILISATIVAAALHASQQAHGNLEVAVVILSIGLPAFAGAITGIAGLEQHSRHAEHFQLMARRLEGLADHLRREVDLGSVREVALRVEAELRTEGNAWIDVMRFQDVDLPA